MGRSTAAQYLLWLTIVTAITFLNERNVATSEMSVPKPGGQAPPSGETVSAFEKSRTDLQKDEAQPRLNPNMLWRKSDGALLDIRQDLSAHVAKLPPERHYKLLSAVADGEFSEWYVFFAIRLHLAHFPNVYIGTGTRIQKHPSHV